MKPLPILRDAWYFYSRNLLSIALLCGPLLLLEGIAKHMLRGPIGEDPSLGVVLVFGLIFAPLYKGVLICFLASRSGTEPVSAGQLYAAALRLWPAYALLSGLVLVVSLLGFTLLVIPGIWIAIKLCFADYLLVLRGLQPMEALRESFRLTTGHFWNLLICTLCAGVPLLLIAAWVANPETGLLNQSLTDIPLEALIGLTQLFMVVVVFRYFMLVEAADKPA